MLLIDILERSVPEFVFALRLLHPYLHL